MTTLFIPQRLVGRVLTRLEVREAMERAGRPLSDEELVALASTPRQEPPTDLELRTMAARDRDRVEGCIVTPPARSNFHDA